MDKNKKRIIKLLTSIINQYPKLRFTQIIDWMNCEFYSVDEMVIEKLLQIKELYRKLKKEKNFKLTFKTKNELKFLKKIIA